jgi:hypothetical protein
MSFSSTMIDRLALFAMVGLLVLVALTNVVPGRAAHSFRVAEPEAVRGSLTENAVAFLTNSALVLPAETVEWVRTARHYDLYRTTQAQTRPEGRP